MSLIVALSACGLNRRASPPCNAEDVQTAYDAQGKMRGDGLFLHYRCYERMRGDLNACYEGKLP